MSDRAAEIAEALEQADLNALRLALFQLTGNTELLDMPLEMVPIKNGRLWQAQVKQDRHARLKELATAYLTHGRTEVPPRPDRETIVSLLSAFSGRELTGHELDMAIEELGLSDFPREVREGLKPGVTIPDGFHVTIVGAGVSGIAAAVYLQRLGVDFTIVDRQPRFGGTWVINHYPGLRVDVSSFIYQFKFAPNHWRSQYAPQAEVLEYLEQVVDRFDLQDCARLGVEVESATWDDSARRWAVELADGTTLSSNFVISASGLFATPSTPDIDGLADFGGTMMHTAAWDDDYDVTGKSVALIGNGSSGTQLMPWLCSQGSKVSAFQRSANWIAPVVLYHDEVPHGVYWLFDNLPYYKEWHLYGAAETSVKSERGHDLDPEWFAEHGTLSEGNDKLRESLIDYIRLKLDGRPDLIEKSIPKQTPLARRLIVDNGWYDSLKLPHVELVTDSIVGIDETGINTADGTHHDVDVIVLGSGFEVSKYFWPVTYVGASGATMEEGWAKDGARSYKGVMFPDFPNFYSCYGPNGQARAGGYPLWAESWGRNVATLICAMLNEGADVIEVRQEAFEEWNEALDQQFERVVWGAAPAGGYYINPQGRPGVHMPFPSAEYYAMMAAPDLDDFDLR